MAFLVVTWYTRQTISHCRVTSVVYLYTGFLPQTEKKLFCLFFPCLLVDIFVRSSFFPRRFITESLHRFSVLYLPRYLFPSCFSFFVMQLLCISVLFFLLFLYFFRPSSCFADPSFFSLFSHSYSLYISRLSPSSLARSYTASIHIHL